MSPQDSTASEATTVESDAPGHSYGWLEAPHPQDLVITILADNLRHRRNDVWSGGLVELLGELGFSTGASRVALARLANRGLISRIKSGRKVAYQITERAHSILREGDQRIFTLGEMQGDADTVTMLWHSLRENQRLERGNLARRLRFLGFGSLQDATWVAPGDREDLVISLIRDLEISESCALVIGRGSAELGLGQLIDQAWDLSTLCGRYREYLNIFRTYATRKGRGTLTDREAFVVRTQAMHNFRQFPYLDPGLPADAYPDARARAESIKLFHTVYDGLKKPANRHFDKVTIE